MGTQVRKCEEDVDKTIYSGVSFSKFLSTEVITKGLFVPVKIFKHSCQTIYNKLRVALTAMFR